MTPDILSRESYFYDSIIKNPFLTRYSYSLFILVTVSTTGALSNQGVVNYITMLVRDTTHSSSRCTDSTGSFGTFETSLQFTVSRRGRRWPHNSRHCQGSTVISRLPEEREDVHRAVVNDRFPICQRKSPGNKPTYPGVFILTSSSFMPHVRAQCFPGMGNHPVPNGVARIQCEYSARLPASILTSSH